MCVKRGLGLPKYDILKQDGPSHNPTFSTFCRVQDHYRVASADTKKKGKEMAARQVIMCIRKCKFLFSIVAIALRVFRVIK